MRRDKLTQNMLRTYLQEKQRVCTLSKAEARTLKEMTRNDEQTR